MNYISEGSVSHINGVWQTLQLVGSTVLHSAHRKTACACIESYPINTLLHGHTLTIFQVHRSLLIVFVSSSIESSTVSEASAIDGWNARMLMC